MLIKTAKSIVYLLCSAFITVNLAFAAKPTPTTTPTTTPTPKAKKTPESKQTPKAFKPFAPIIFESLLGYTELADKQKNLFICANVGTVKKPVWHSGLVKKGKFTFNQKALDRLLIDSKRTKLSPKKQKKLKLLKEQQKKCKKEGKLLPGNSKPLPPPQPTPSTPPNTNANPAPIARNGTYNGKGIEPIAITFDVTPGKEGLKPTCFIIAEPTGLKVELFPNCTALLTPLDHNVQTVSFEFYATNMGETAPSNTATIIATWDQSANFSGDYHSLAQYRSNLSEQEAMQIIRWVALGRDRDNLLRIATQPDGLSKLIDTLLTPNNCDVVEADALFQAQQKFIYGYQNQSVYVDRNNDGRADDLTGDGVADRVSGLYSTPQDDTRWWTIAAMHRYMTHMMRNGCDPLRERMALLFHNHFTVNLSNFGVSTGQDLFILNHLNLLRSKHIESAGQTFLPLDAFVSKLHADGAMLRYLDNIWNRYDQQTNENYARELMELFVLSPNDIITGAQNYNEKDIYAMTYALTGFIETTSPDPRALSVYCDPARDADCVGAMEPYRSLNQSTPGFNDNLWNNTSRPRPTFLFEGTEWGKNEAFKANSLIAGEDTLTPYLMYQHPGSARYLAARLYSTFASIEPTNEIISSLADTLKGEKFSGSQTIKKILSSSAYFSEKAKADCVAAPAETFMSFINLLDLPVHRVEASGNLPAIDIYDRIEYALTGSGQSIGRPPSVFGYRECGKITGNHIHNGLHWVSTQYWYERFKRFTDIINDIHRLKDRVGFSWNNLLPPDSASQRNPSAIVAHISRKLGITLTAKESELLTYYLSNYAMTLKPDNTFDDYNLRKPNITDMNNVEFDQWWTLKGPGLLELIFSLRQNHVR